MKPKAQDIELDQAQPGMILAEDVKDGRTVLLPKGSVLSAPQLSSLARRGVAQLRVECPAVPPTSEEIEAARQRLAHIFRRVGDDDLSRALQGALLNFRSGAPK